MGSGERRNIGGALVRRLLLHYTHRVHFATIRISIFNTYIFTAEQWVDIRVYTYVVLTSKLRAIWNIVEYLKNEIFSV